MSLINYWPSLEEINKCIKSEAENVIDEVLLTVHQESPLVYLQIGPDGRSMPESRRNASEGELLDWLLGSAPEGSVVLPITGASGVGKSHLIRMIDAKLRQLPNSDRYLVIRIPKSASLKKVVELILNAEPLKSEKYDRIKSEFSKALAELTIEEAVILFSSHLEIELNKYKLRLLESLKQDSSNASLRERIGHADKLPMLMNDADTVNHFRTKVLPRIIQRSVKGVDFKEGEFTEVDSTTSQFNVKDLDLSDLELGQANQKVSSYYLHLVAQEGKGKAVAVEVLNDVIDQATSELYKLNESLGGMTLGEVILEIRRLLGEEDEVQGQSRDLIILVEDFAALVGIQETLAKVLIQEGSPGGTKKFATIRSAIAVTDGYLLGKQTIATRAGREWIIESQLQSEEETLSRTRKMVAAYLNASRIGELQLKKFFKEKTSDGLKPLFKSSDDEETIRLIEAFGYEDNVPLFPFTSHAIERLARSSLTSGSFLEFNPRFVIKTIIRDVLEFGRNAFSNKQFPPVSISTGEPSGQIATWISSLKGSEDLKDRYARLITTWGNNPERIEDIGRISKEIFEAFSLPFPELGNVVLDKPIIDKPVSPHTNKEPDNSPQEQRINEYNKIIENWVRNNTKLPQNVALEIRRNVAALLNKRIDWNAERCLSATFEFEAKEISIENSGGQGNILLDAIIKIEPVNNDASGKLREALKSILRKNEVYKGSSLYKGMDDDMINISDFIECLLPTAQSIVREKLKKQNQSLIFALEANSRLLGLSDKKSSLKSLSSLLFSDAPSLEQLFNNENQSFNELRIIQINAFNARASLQKNLINLNGCFQGQGPTTWGIDIVRVFESMPDREFRLDPREINRFDPPVVEYLQNNRDADVSRKMSQVLNEVNRINTLVKLKLEINFDKNQVTQALKDLTSQLRSMGAWDNTNIGIPANDFITLCDSFNSSALKESLAIANSIEDIKDDEDVLTKKFVLGSQLKLNPLILSERLIIFAEKILTYADGYANRNEELYGGIRPEDKLKEIQDEFKNIAKSLSSLEEAV